MGRSSSLRAQEVRRSFCSCPLPEVLPIKAQPFWLCVCLLLSEHTLSCLFHKQLPYPNHFITIHNNPAI